MVLPVRVFTKICISPYRPTNQQIKWALQKICRHQHDQVDLTGRSNMEDLVNGHDRLDLHLESFLTHCNFMKAILQHSDILITRGSATHSDRRLKALQELHSVLKYCAWLVYQCRDHQPPPLLAIEEPPATLEPIVDVSGCEHEPIKTEEPESKTVNHDHDDDTDANSSQEPPPPTTRSRSLKKKRRLIDSTPNCQRVP
eukprot:Protomagalhaensia_wolfi_Nauph_80__3457@NODE_3503_length_780_cov_574_564103_g688_i1_p1_GENE_NODE_3503_length_780_cov_574_564103_g688_i1NODE_3503_length_780_cov_574_564103_g688_i1_p1_ORF_typecomplete_len199_score20_72Pap_E4/PF02711_14/15Pap_E4/PF02711_14/19_NODE_3503_length_780_cov_574_564103_g688_i187683